MLAMKQKSHLIFYTRLFLIRVAGVCWSLSQRITARGRDTPQMVASQSWGTHTIHSRIHTYGQFRVSN